MNRGLFVFLLTLTIAIRHAGAQSPPGQEELQQQVATLLQRVQQLEVENGQLRQQVLDLEIQLGVKTLSGSKGRGVMRIEQVRRFVPSEADFAEIRRLRDEADSLNKSAAAKRDAAEGDGDRRTLMPDALKLEREARKLSTQADRKEEALTGHFWIMGWDGSKDIMLWTDGIAAGAIEYMCVGQYLTWWGDQLEVALGHPTESDFASFRATDAKLVNPHVWFTERPAGRVPVWGQQPAAGSSVSPFPRLPGG